MAENLDPAMKEAEPSTPAARVKRTKRMAKVVFTPETKTKSRKRSSKHSPGQREISDIWAVQCKECRKWRVISTQEEYEEIRKKVREDPFICSKKQNVSCNDPADLEYGSKRIWVIDRPNLPKTPPNFTRRVTLRRNLSRMDCFYVTPNNKKLRGPNEVAAFLEEHPEIKDVAVADFSFSTPKIARDTIPPNVDGTEGSSIQVD